MGVENWKLEGRVKKQSTLPSHRFLAFFSLIKHTSNRIKLGLHHNPSPQTSTSSINTLTPLIHSHPDTHSQLHFTHLIHLSVSPTVHFLRVLVLFFPASTLLPWILQTKSEARLKHTIKPVQDNIHLCQITHGRTVDTEV